MQTLLTTDYEDEVARLDMFWAPEIGDEVMVLEGTRSAAWKVVGRRWFAPHYTDDAPEWTQYLVLRVEPAPSPDTAPGWTGERIGP